MFDFFVRGPKIGHLLKSYACNLRPSQIDFQNQRQQIPKPHDFNRAVCLSCFPASMPSTSTSLDIEFSFGFRKYTYLIISK